MKKKNKHRNQSFGSYENASEKKNQNFEPSMFQQEEPIKVKRRQP